jgi:hypothetical protein
MNEVRLQSSPYGSRAQSIVNFNDLSLRHLFRSSKVLLQSQHNMSTIEKGTKSEKLISKKADLQKNSRLSLFLQHLLVLPSRSEFGPFSLISATSTYGGIQVLNNNVSCLMKKIYTKALKSHLSYQILLFISRRMFFARCFLRQIGRYKF